MLVNIFKSNQKVISLLVVFLSILLWLPSFWIDQNELINTDILSFYLSNKVVAFFVSSLLVGFQAIYLNYMVNEFKLLKSPTHLPALLFLVLNVGYSSLLVFTPLLIVNTLLLVVLHQLFLIYNQNNVFSLAFNSGVVMAIAVLIYFPSILILPLLWVALLYTKPPNWREMVIVLLGFLVPIVFYVAYYFLTDQMASLFTFGWGGGRIFKLAAFPTTIISKSFFLVLLVVGFFSGLNFLKVLSAQVVKIKKHLVILSLLFILLLSVLLLNDTDYLATYVLLTIPLAVIIAGFLNDIKRKWLAELIFAFLLISIVVGYFS